MNKKYITLGILVVIIGFIAISLYKKSHQGAVMSNVSYFCQEGILKVQYGTNNVVLTFKDGDNILLPQVVSASGIRYALGDTTFLSKGANAFLTVGSSTPYTNCVSGDRVTNNDTNTFTDSAKTFSFSYPDTFTLSGGDIGYTQDWSVQGTDLGLQLAQVMIPKSFFAGKTNFSEAKVTVGTSASDHAIKNCLISDRSNEGDVQKVMIGNREFTRITYGDAGAGNFYETQSYRAIYNNQCYAIEYTIHSTNIYNYPTELGVKEFDKAKVTSVLENIVQSFKFI